MRVTIGEEHAGWACGTCKKVFLQGDQTLETCEREADNHCALFCVWCGLGLGRPRPNAICLKCINEMERAKELACFAEATKVPMEQASGWVVVPGTDLFFESIEQFLLEQPTLEEPVEFLWLCTATHLNLDGMADLVVDQALADHYENAAVSEEDRALLQGMLDLWARNQKITSWDRDCTRAVILDKAVVGPP